MIGFLQREGRLELEDSIQFDNKGWTQHGALEFELEST